MNLPRGTARFCPVRSLDSDLASTKIMVAVLVKLSRTELHGAQ
jgi:hypothetical protein